MNDIKTQSGASALHKTKRRLIIEALKKNRGYDGHENSDITIGRIMGIMEITDAELGLKP